MLMRTRLLWFAAGFGTTGAAIGQFVWRDLWIERTSLVLEMKQKFDDLEARVSKFEAVPVPVTVPVPNGNSD